MTGVDILHERIETARRLLPQVNFTCGDATQLDWPDGSFDIVTASTMFIQILNDDLAQRIAAEMTRVSRRWILVIDWCYGDPRTSIYRAVTLARVRKLFPEATVELVRRGAMIQPLGRFLSKHLPSAYFLVHRLAPFACSQLVTLLCKE